MLMEENEKLKKYPYYNQICCLFFLIFNQEPTPTY